MTSGDEVYHPKDAVGAAINGTLITAGAGTLISAVQNTLAKRNVGPWGVFTRTGGTIAVFAAMGGTYEFTRYACANLRERDDSFNTTIGGFLAGSVLGLRFGTTPAVLGMGALTAVVLGTYDYAGGKLTGYRGKFADDEFEQREFARKNRRRPIQEVMEEFREEKGVRWEGYDERRRERIKAHYGIDVPAKE